MTGWHTSCHDDNQWADHPHALNAFLCSYTLGDLMEMCSFRIPEPGVRDVEISGIQDRPEEVV